MRPPARRFLCAFGDDDLQMAEPLLHARRAAAAARMEAAHHHRAPHLGARHHQPIDVELMVVLGVGDRALQRLLHLLRDAALGEGQRRHRLLRRLVADQPGHQVELARRDTQVRHDRLRLGVGDAARMIGLAHDRLARLSPEWPVKVRVGENSPNLWPDHVLVHLHRQELVAVVDAEGQADELRQDRRAARPDADDLVAARLARGIRLVQQIAVDERTLPDGTRHLTCPCCGGG